MLGFIWALSHYACSCPTQGTLDLIIKETEESSYSAKTLGRSVTSASTINFFLLPSFDSFLSHNNIAL